MKSIKGDFFLVILSNIAQKGVQILGTLKQIIFFGDIQITFDLTETTVIIHYLTFYPTFFLIRFDEVIAFISGL